jgi:ATP-dependent Clp protease ATP-binding subunit ClpA
VLQRRIENELARRMLSGEVKDGQCVTVDFAEGEYRFTAKDGEPKVVEGEVVAA